MCIRDRIKDLVIHSFGVSHDANEPVAYNVTCDDKKASVITDLGYYDEEGNLFFASRKDFQIKHMGHRIELGEIEVAVNALDFIDVGCCIFDDKREKIVLCYQSKEACDKQIVRELARVLPKFMWPQKFKHFEQLPMNKNSKLDRVLLKEICCKEGAE